MAEDPSISNNQQQVSLKEPFSVKWTDKFQVIIFTGIFVAAIGAGLQLFKSALVGTLASSDDAPILMAGGSFYMYAGGSGSLRKDTNNHKLIHEDKGKNKLRVYALDLVDTHGKLTQVKDIRPNAWGKVVFTYCPDVACVGLPDTITLTFDNRGNDNISISTDRSNIDDSTMSANGVLDHPHPAWFLNRVAFQDWNNASPPPDTSCTPSGHCTVIIHTCSPGGCQ